jgi:hypothetical protein
MHAVGFLMRRERFGEKDKRSGSWDSVYNVREKLCIAEKKVRRIPDDSGLQICRQY